MLTRRNFLQTTAVAALLPHWLAHAQGVEVTALQLQHFPADEGGFSRAPVLLSGASEAILIDGGFRLSDGHALAEVIVATGKKLTTIYISQSDPDYYFGLGPVMQAFLEAVVVAAPETVMAIAANVEKKLAVWGPQLRDNGPQRREDLVFAQPWGAPALMHEGHRIDIVPAQGMDNRRYLWVPSLQAIVGGVLVFDGLHVWMADTPTAQERHAWRENLQAMLERQPKVVVPGHMAAGSKLDASALRFTLQYLQAYERALVMARSSEELIQSMLQRYPDLPGVSSLELGARVVMGEMQWG